MLLRHPHRRVWGRGAGGAVPAAAGQFWGTKRTNRPPPRWCGRVARGYRAAGGAGAREHPVQVGDNSRAAAGLQHTPRL